MSKITIIKLGGSVVSREDNIFDFDYLIKLKEILQVLADKGEKFGIILGGGFTCRNYIKLAREHGIQNNNDLHWIGTTTNVMHAELARSVFGELAAPRPLMYEDYYSDNEINFDQPVIIGGGGRPGHSGDVDALLLSNKLKADTIISFKNIDHLYTADPKSDPSAVVVEKATWDDYFRIIGGKDVHEPGGNYIVDPVGAKMGQANGKTFIIIKGSDLDNAANLLNHNTFKGSVISDRIS